MGWRTLGLVLGAAATLGAQGFAPDELRARSHPYVPPPPPNTLRTDVNLVEVPVVVRDSKHRAVADLRQSDFEVYDAGKKQTITSFAVETFTPNSAPTASTAPAATADPATRAASPAAASHRPRYIMMVFDNLSTSFEDLKRTKDAATRFVQSSLAPGDMVTIVTTALSHSTAFTADVAQLAGSIEKITVQSRYSDDNSSCPRITAYQAYVIVNRLDSQTLNGVVDEDMACKQLQRGPATEDVNSLARAVWEHARANSANTLYSLRSLVDALGRMPGRRMLLLASSGFLSGDLEMEEDELISRAVHAEVVINALDAKGLYAYTGGRPIEAPPARGRSMRTQIAEASIQGRQAQAKDDGMAVLAQGTGGQFYHNSNDLNRGFRELGALPEVVYVLGFSPSDANPDGRYHSLKVKLARGGHSLQARLGYTAASRNAATQHAPSKLDLALTAQDLPADVAASMSVQPGNAEGGNPRLDVMVNIDVTKLRFDTRAERRIQKLTFLAAFLDSSGNFVTGTQGDVELALKPETLERLGQQGGLNFRLPLQAPPGTYTLRGIVQEGLDGKMTVASQTMVLP